MTVAVPADTPTTCGRHPLHLADRPWPEANCSVDVWIELLHAHGFEPLAALPCAFALDFEGDQWTFLKFPLADLHALYGVEVIELNIWGELLGHLEEQLALGRAALVEVDAFYLPDTAGTSYRAAHVKTSIAVHVLDRPARRLGYFHNTGCYELAGPDFDGLFNQAAAGQLPPYVEVAKFGSGSPGAGRALVDASRHLLTDQLARRPADNPFHRYAARFAADLGVLTTEPLEYFHRYAFATFRQCGAAFDLGAAYLRWLAAHGDEGLADVTSACDVIATTAKTLQFKTARFVNANRSFDARPLLDTMAAAWDDAMTGLVARYGALTHPD